MKRYVYPLTALLGYSSPLLKNAEKRPQKRVEDENLWLDVVVVIHLVAVVFRRWSIRSIYSLNILKSAFISLGGFSTCHTLESFKRPNVQIILLTIHLSQSCFRIPCTGNHDNINSCSAPTDFLSIGLRFCNNDSSRVTLQKHIHATLDDSSFKNISHNLNATSKLGAGGRQCFVHGWGDNPSAYILNHERMFFPPAGYW